jgi:putative chitinase
MTVPEAMSTLRGWRQSVEALWNSQRAALDGLAGAPPAAGSQSLTLEQLRAIMPTLSRDKAAQYLPYLNRAMAEGGITTPLRKAAFLAQLGHESSDLKYFKELADGSEYEGRSDLGNTQTGDGPRFKGGGPIQITGRSNYRLAGQALGLDLEAHPELAATPDVGFRTAQWFWNSHHLNELADTGNFSEITQRINGGDHGAADRNRRYAIAKRVLGA